VLDPAEARDVPIPKFEKPKPQKYEIRLIIWEVFNLPLSGKKAIDIFFKVTMDGEGWRSNSIVKETDAHLGSTDGYGEFNYRLIFGLTLPCAFPRLKIAAFDYAAFSSDEAIGSATIDFNDWMETL
jgi:hypothetical protein